MLPPPWWKPPAALIRSSTSRSRARPDLAGSWCPWYFPRLGEYARVLETAGFWVTTARTFPRPSHMPDSAERSGIRGWLELFASELVQGLGADERRRFFELVERESRAALFREGVWWIDYVRLRVTAVRPGPGQGAYGPYGAYTKTWSNKADVLSP